ncbi:metal ABC transporter substrate-binding protein [Eubacteriales bacterium OttesenSCG-928-N13]|nr:metal ABC transporter substrate-binding protein [Eubacteriales bacterium OttesenSCG-928-N13]
MSKTLRLCVLLLALCMALVGCAQQPIEEQGEQIEQRTIYTSFFPLYTLAQGILDGVPGMQLKCLVQPQDGCLRLYDLSDWDLTRILASDAIIIGGRGLESFETTLISLGEDGPALMSVMDGLTLEGTSSVDVDGEQQSHLEGQNPWLFLSVDGAEQISEMIAGGMVTLDPGYQAAYDSNFEKRSKQLEQLRGQMLEALLSVDPQPVALMHEGLIYLAQDLGLHVVARVDREPGSTLYGADWDEALLQLNESGAKIVLLERQAPQHMIEALEQAGYDPVLIDTFSTFPFDADSGHYDRTMLANAEAIAQAFKDHK